jgi:MAF protein/D-tyrosyl-tRNA(Tyr) deacylase
MRALLQRVTRASVRVDGSTIGAIGPGILALAGVAKDDSEADADWIGRKIALLRIFPDEERRMNRSVVDAGGAVLLVSQFTLHADARKGRRPSFEKVAGPELAVPLLDRLRLAIEREGVHVESGRFGAMMDVELVNDGPVTIFLDSEESRAEPAQSSDATRVRFSARRALVAPGSPLFARPLTLASASERRRDLLEELGLPFVIDASDADEENDVPSDPERHVLVLAERKARAVAARRAEGLVLGADTIVVLDARILGKPRDAADAFAMLRSLAGREHMVWSGVCVLDAASGAARARAAATRVRFHAATDDELREYVESGEPFGKAGAYAIQGTGRFLVAGIEGDYTNVVGLPIGVTLDLLAEAVAIAPAPHPGSRT